MKKLLLLFAVLLSAVGAWAQPQISGAPVDGQWAANTTWYRVETGNNYSLQIDRVTSQGYLALTSTTDSNSDIALWCVVGNQEGGYKFYNKAKGTSLVLGMTGSGDNASAVFVEDGADGYTTFFDFVQSEKTGNTYWCIKAHGTDYNHWNRKNSGDNRLKYWNSDQAPKGDNGSAFLFTEVDLTTLEYATSDDITTARNLISVAPGYPKTTTSQYITLNELTQCSGVVKSELTSAVNAYKTCSDILLPEDGKAYTLTAMFKDGKQYKLNYTNGQKLSVSDEVTASTFVCKELRAGVYAFITEDGKILTWVGKNENGAFKEADFTSPRGYSNYFATTYNERSDWNEFTVKKNDTNEEQLGFLRLVAYRNKTDRSSLYANKGKGFEQAGDGNLYNADNTSAWILTEVEHTNTEAQNIALKKIDAKVAVSAKTPGETICKYTYKNGDNDITNVNDVNSAIDNCTSVAAVEAILNSATINMPVKGKFYRFKHPSRDAYMLSDRYNDKHLAMGALATGTNNVTSIFYYGESGNLLSYAIGRYLSDASKSSSDWKCLAVGVVGNAATFGAGSQNGTLGFYVGNDATRAYYSGNAQNGYVNAGGSFGSNAGYDWVLEEVTELPVTISDAGYATFYAPVAVQANGVTANTVTINGQYATLNAIDGGVIPANTGVILSGDAGTYDLDITTTSNEITSILEGSAATSYIQKDAYVLANGENGVGLYKASKNFTVNNTTGIGTKVTEDGTHFLNNGFKAYLPASALTSAEVRFLAFNLGGNETAIESVEGNDNGAETVVYDLAGRRVQSAQKGVFIVNGKVVIK